MEILFLSKTRSGVCRRFNAGWGSLVLGVAALMVVAAGLAWLGILAGIGQQPITQAQIHEVLATEIARQRAAVSDTTVAAQRYMNSLSQQLGQMRASMLRLEALGKHLTAMADLDGSEFDFTNKPAMGGPEDPAASNVVVPDFIQALKELAQQIDDRADKLHALELVLMNRELQARTMPAGRPVTKGWVSSLFGQRTDPISGKKVFHQGVDIAGKEGSDVVVVADGVVSWAGKRYGYGILVEVTHGNGYVTRYAHNKEAVVAVGDKVTKGQLIAAMGSTGRSTGPHVHFEVIRDGKVVNPQKYFQASR